MGKIIVIEGTDCSGKETQSNNLINNLENLGYKVAKMSFPNYDSPTGKIIGGPYLGKPEIGESWFTEGAVNVDPMVASLYYAADRRHELNNILKLVNENDYLILDRYVYSNMAHQGGKLLDENKRKEMYSFLSTLEFDLLKLPKPDLVIFLYMPYEYACMLKKNRTQLDAHEMSEEHLKNAEKTYLEITNLFGFDMVNCVLNDEIRTKEDISEEVLTKVLKIK